MVEGEPVVAGAGGGDSSVNSIWAGAQAKPSLSTGMNDAFHIRIYNTEYFWSQNYPCEEHVRDVFP